eukprot:TRINITY_DN13719_c0_g1_i2.p1 TRINITY_DN13719_c0_g1~~TRINITY_DN13719_c0_g1_i2.p1  ORF type:complete len:150 (-),score=11.13 TRINITY_DN13719_c0_g1_i2:68-517(-)
MAWSLLLLAFALAHMSSGHRIEKQNISFAWATIYSYCAKCGGKNGKHVLMWRVGAGGYGGAKWAVRVDEECQDTSYLEKHTECKYLGEDKTGSLLTPGKKSSYETAKQCAEEVTGYVCETKMPKVTTQECGGVMKECPATGPAVYIGSR